MATESYHEHGQGEVWNEDRWVVYNPEAEQAPQQHGWRKRRRDDEERSPSASKRAKHQNGYDSRYGYDDNLVDSRINSFEDQNWAYHAPFQPAETTRQHTSTWKPITKLSIDTPPRSPDLAQESSSRNQDAVFFNTGPTYSRQLATKVALDVSFRAPSVAYESITRHSPEAYEPSSLLPLTSPEADTSEEALPSRQLVVLDLNGSLLYRASSVNGKRAMWRRPYLDCFVQYLSHERTTNGLLIERASNNKGKRHFHLLPDSIPNFSFTPESRVDRRKEKKQRKKLQKQQQQQQTISPGTTDAIINAERLENLRSLRKQLKTHPERFTLLAPLDAMVWSSVQPQNLPPMVDTAFGKRQGCLRACWSRSMLGLNAAGFHQRVQTTKNLDRIWWSAQGRYGAASTLLIDDTALKARLQPWNLLQINEYVAKKQKATSLRDKSSSSIYLSANTDDRESSLTVDVPTDLEEEPESVPILDEAKDSTEENKEDRTLLAVIGVLEELRGQRNIPAWMREGGIWSFLQQATSSIPVLDQAEDVEPSPPTNGTLDGPVVAGPEIEEEGDLRLWCMDPDALAHWTAKGVKALQCRSIPVAPGIIVAAQDDQLVELGKLRTMYS